MRERIAVSLIARDEEVSFEDAALMWDKWKQSAQEGHYGDCTSQPITCMKCLVDDFYGYADQILALIKEANYVKLADDQSLPELPPYSQMDSIASSISKEVGYKDAQQDMFKAGFRKVEGIRTEGE